MAARQRTTRHPPQQPRRRRLPAAAPLHVRHAQAPLCALRGERRADITQQVVEALAMCQEDFSELHEALLKSKHGPWHTNINFTILARILNGLDFRIYMIKLDFLPFSTNTTHNSSAAQCTAVSGSFLQTTAFI